MEYLVLILVLIVVGFALARAARRRMLVPPLEGQPATQSAANPVAAGEPAVAVGTPDEPVAAAEPDESDAAALPDEPDAVLASALPEPPVLADRLHELDRVLAQLGSSCAHPRELAENPQFKQAVGLLEDVDVDLDTVAQYALGADWALACAALAALAKRDDGKHAVDKVLAQFDKLVPWAMYFALAYFVETVPRPPVGAPVVGAKDWWPNMPVLPLLFRDYLVRRAALNDAAEFGNALHSQAASPTPLIKAFLERLDHPLATALMSRLDSIQKGNIDHAFLSSFGRFWVDQKKPQTLVEPDSWNVPLATAQSTLLATPVRSLLVSGEQLVGKTSFLRLLAKRLAGSNWSVFEASGADLMAGQIWFGQLPRGVFAKWSTRSRSEKS